MPKHDSIERWHRVDKEFIETYMSLFGDRNLLHTDKFFAMAMLGEKLCQERVVHGALIQGLLSEDIWQEFGDGAAISGGDKLRFLIPIQEDDEVGFHYDRSDCEITGIKYPGDNAWEGNKFSNLKVIAFTRRQNRVWRSSALTLEITAPTSETLAMVTALAVELKARSESHVA